MKVNLSSEQFNDYLNIKSLEELNTLEDFSIVKLFMPTVFNSIPVDKISEVFSLVFRKMVIGGELIVGSTDRVELCKLILRYDIPVEQINDIISNSQTLFALDEVTEILGKFNFKVMNRSLSGINYIIEAVKL